MTDHPTPEETKEALRLRDKLYEAAKGVRSKDELAAFLTTFDEYPDDYDFGVYKPVAAAIAAAWAHSDGITGFMAGAICWDFITQWGAFGAFESGARFVDMDNLLFPQYQGRFTTIPAAVWEKIQARAQAKLDTNHDVHPDVKAHWESIVRGEVPFGLQVESAPRKELDEVMAELRLQEERR